MAAKSTSLPEGIEDHGAFQRRMWAVQRIAWIVFFLILLASLVGLTGRGGPFSRQTVETAGGSIELPSISRWNAPEDLRVVFAPSPADPVLFVDARFLEAFAVEAIEPPPKATVREGGRIGYVFAADPSAAATVVFRLETAEFGMRRYRIGIGGDVADRSTFILP